MRALPLVLLLVATAGCASLGTSGSFPDDATARPAVDVPARFEPEDPALRLTPGDTIAGDGCRSPMVDPRDGTRIRFIRALVTRADYEVPGGRYGTGAGDVLRLDCNTGRVIGIVRR